MPGSAVIVGMARTPIGAFQGALAPLSASDLGAVAVGEALRRAGLTAETADEAILGCVLSAGQGQAPARQAALKAGLPAATPCLTINKMCGSGLQAVMLARNALTAGDARVMVAGGMESMSNAPYLLDKGRGGYRMGHGKILDHMFLDGLEDAYDTGKLMGVFADETARALNLTRAEQDAFALASLERARAAQENGDFTAEIAPVTVKIRGGDLTVTEDESPKTARPEKIPQLKPAFTAEGTVTAANASSISDGAAALVLTTAAEAAARGAMPLARLVAQARHAQKPAEFTLAPIGAIEKVLHATGWTAAEVDLFEINEAFAVVTLAAMKALKIPHEKTNIRGGACALGHPIGASGARILITLVASLRARGLKKGIAALCIGGGEAVAVAVDIP